MTLFNYNTIMLLGLFGGLCITSFAYATTSAPASGPSVGHRPVVTNLKLGTNAGDITSSSTTLNPGDVINLTDAAGGPNGMDVDGDLDKAGAHCVWYRVDTNGVETVARDPGPNDRNCIYTIQTGDAGHKIKNVITLFSDQDSATQKGYTLNPTASMPVTTVSNGVVSGKFKSLTYNKKHTIEPRYFHVKPNPAFVKAKFTYDTHESPTEYIWQSSNPSVMSVSSTGEVTIQRDFSQPVTITATSKKTGAILSDTKNDLSNWIESARVEMNYADAKNYCQSKGMRLIRPEDWSHSGESIRYNWYPDGVPNEAFGLDEAYWTEQQRPFANSLNNIFNPGYATNINAKHYVACSRR